MLSQDQLSSGNITYANTGMTALENCTVDLYNDAAEMIFSTTTDVAGYFEFPGLLDGNYSIETGCTLAHGGTGLVDVVQTRQFLLGQATFSTLQQLSADVDASGAPGLVDVVQMRQFLLGQITGWDQTDWVFETQAVMVSGGNVANDYQGLCSGDPDGSHTPAK